MTGIGLAVLWIGYTAFAYGHAITKGAQVSFTDMVLPSHRAYAQEQILHAKLPDNAQQSSPGLLDQIFNYLTPNPLAGGLPTPPGIPNPAPKAGTALHSVTGQ